MTSSWSEQQDANLNICHENLLSAADLMKINADKLRKEKTNLKVGDLVLIKRGFFPAGHQRGLDLAYMGPATILEQMPNRNNTFLVLNSDGTRSWVTGERLTKYHERTNKEFEQKKRISFSPKDTVHSFDPEVATTNLVEKSRRDKTPVVFPTTRPASNGIDLDMSNHDVADLNMTTNTEIFLPTDNQSSDSQDRTRT